MEKHIAKIIKDSTGLVFLDPDSERDVLLRIINDLLECQDNGQGFPDTLETWTRDGGLSERDARIIAETLARSHWYWKRKYALETASAN